MDIVCELSLTAVVRPFVEVPSLYNVVPPYLLIVHILFVGQVNVF